MGHRSVPVELGASYLSPDASSQLLTVDAFLRTQVLSESQDKGYIAQHALFEQIPELKKDFSLPEHTCLLQDEDGDCEEVLLNGETHRTATLYLFLVHS
jgi:lysine-specific demethylase 8